MPDLPVTPQARMRADMEMFCRMIETYKMQLDEWPPEEAAAFARIMEGKGSRMYPLTRFDPSQVNKREEPVDAWGESFRFKFSGEKMRIVSAGADRRFDTADDVIVEK